MTERRTRIIRLVIVVSLIVLVVGGLLVYVRFNALRSWIFGSSRVSGMPGATTLTLPPGFQASIFADGLSAPRFLAFGPDGTLFVAESGADQVTALPDPHHTGKATRHVVVASGLDSPTSLAFHQNELYIGETSKITRLLLGSGYRGIQQRVIIPDLPATGNHTTRTVLIGPDNALYVSIGSSCNNCVEQDKRRASVWRYALDGSQGRLYADGLRNAVGMAINPWNQQIWVTNNGRDLLGDDTPPETVYALQDGGHYGWPYCHAGDIPDPELGKPDSCHGIIKPLLKMQAHSAPLGLAFYRQQAFPEHYHGLYIAFHGSWNRSVPTGYKVVFVPLNAQGNVAGPAQDFATGWLQQNAATGRPVGLAVGPDGALYVSDDKAGLIYRIVATQQGSAAMPPAPYRV
uniref:L-sorbosone dehydrogenase n=1 Tax=Thermosporothrix sp. COM3 TaxID=2490863 RepID=A0A455SRH2_9CHLR|nr:L-sorbosone dehydrogenase [Thermosporothrix sp. COM3]